MCISHRNLFSKEMASAAALILDSEIEKYADMIPTGYTVYGRLDGIVQKLGKSAGTEANWCFEARDSDGNECLLMYCNPGVFTIIDRASVDKIHVVNGKTVTWYLMQVGYIACRAYIDGGNHILYLHQYIAGHRGHGRGQESVDHLNRNKLDNRASNLAIKTQAEQNENTGKRQRKYNAKDLPDGIAQEDLPKYVVYYKEITNKETGRCREFFRVEKHPIQKMKQSGVTIHDPDGVIVQKWATSKAVSKSIEEKLEEAKQYIELLDAFM